MSVYSYDNALITTLKDVVGDERVSIIPFEQAFKRSGAVQDDVRLPFISVNRVGYSINRDVITQTGYMRGKLNYTVDETNQQFYVQNLPITINYTMDICTKERQTNDELTRELIWYFFRHPEFYARFNYKNIDHQFGFNVFLGNDIADNSEIADFDNRGQYYRSTLELIIDEAQLLRLDLEADHTIVLRFVASNEKGDEEEVDTIEI